MKGKEGMFQRYRQTRAQTVWGAGAQNKRESIAKVIQEIKNTYNEINKWNNTERYILSFRFLFSWRYAAHLVNGINYVVHNNLEGFT